MKSYSSIDGKRVSGCWLQRCYYTDGGHWRCGASLRVHWLPIPNTLNIVFLFLSPSKPLLQNIETTFALFHFVWRKIFHLFQFLPLPWFFSCQDGSYSFCPHLPKLLVLVQFVSCKNFYLLTEPSADLIISTARNTNWSSINATRIFCDAVLI